jgi:flavorubredoxin
LDKIKPRCAFAQAKAIPFKQIQQICCHHQEMNRAGCLENVYLFKKLDKIQLNRTDGFCEKDYFVFSNLARKA